MWTKFASLIRMTKAIKFIQLPWTQFYDHRHQCVNEEEGILKFVLCFLYNNYYVVLMVSDYLFRVVQDRCWFWAQEAIYGIIVSAWHGPVIRSPRLANLPFSFQRRSYYLHKSKLSPYSLIKLNFDKWKDSERDSRNIALHKLGAKILIYHTFLCNICKHCSESNAHLYANIRHPNQAFDTFIVISSGIRVSLKLQNNDEMKTKLLHLHFVFVWFSPIGLVGGKSLLKIWYISLRNLFTKNFTKLVTK